MKSDRAAGKLYVGLDMVDGTKVPPRPVDWACLDDSLNCRFGQWDFNSEGKGLYPGELALAGFVLAIDGPQGLAGAPGRKMRECEREGGTPGKSPYDFPPPRQIFSGYLTSSIRLFATLWQSGLFHLHGMPREPSHQATLIEVYPGKAWPELATSTQMPLEGKKRSLQGRRERKAILGAAGLSLPSTGIPSHDQLDAALEAFIAYRFAAGRYVQHGDPPVWDSTKGVLREGFIIYP